MKRVVRSRAIWGALTTVNATLPVHIDADTLLACLLLRNTERQWRPHARAFFREVQAEVMMDMVIEGSISFGELSGAVRFWSVEDDIENARWVREMTPRKKGGTTRVTR